MTKRNEANGGASDAAGKRAWTVEAVGPNVHAIRFKDISTGWSQRLLLTGDRHHDSRHTKQDLELKHLDRARAFNAPILDVGDWYCMMQGRYDPRASQSGLRPEHRGDNYFDLVQDDAEEFYAPYAGLFAVIGQGNHEASVLKRNQLDPTKNIARRLRRHSQQEWPFAGGYAGWVFLRFHLGKTHRQTLTIKYHHGSGGGGPVTKGIIQTNRRAVFLPDADLIVTGHIHEAWVFPHRRERINQRGTVSYDYLWHVSVPTYKEEYDPGSGYHIESGRPPKPLGCAWLVLEWDNGRVVPRVELDLA